jgi:hypothetical protein
MKKIVFLFFILVISLSLVNSLSDYSPLNQAHNNLFVKISDIVNQVGNWSSDKINYYNKTDLPIFYVPYTGANQDVDLGNNKLSTSGNFNLSNGVSSLNINPYTNNFEIITNTTSNVWKVYNYNNNGWISMDMYMNDSKNEMNKMLTFGTPGKDKLFAFYHGNNYLNNYDNRGLEIMLLGVPKFTLFNNSMLCINCGNKRVAQDMINTLTIFGNLSTSTFIQANGTIETASGFKVNSSIGLTGNYSVGNCWQSFSGGIMYQTNCTL